jgi:DNA-binding response OmpR family regulator
MRVLVVEDEISLGDVVASRLEKEKYQVDVAVDGEIGLYYALNGNYDLILLDVMMPKMNGFEVLSKIREQNIESKVIMMTAKSELDDKLTGFEKGAIDYITKPFHVEELVARVNAQLKNNYVKNDTIKVGNVELNTKTSTITCIDTNESIDIIGKEYLLLEYLMTNVGQIIEKEQIYNKIWGLDNEIESNNLEAYLSFVRKKLKVIDANISIKAVRGMGYKLEVSDEQVKE